MMNPIKSLKTSFRYLKLQSIFPMNKQEKRFLASFFGNILYISLK